MDNAQIKTMDLFSHLYNQGVTRYQFSQAKHSSMYIHSEFDQRHIQLF
jgi:hypothetical protein